MCSYTKNNDPNYFDEYPDEGNCGSFALNVREWYVSDRDFDNTTIADDMLSYGEDIDDVLEYLTERNVAQILEDFEDEIRLVFSEDEVEDNEELIAFRLGVFEYCEEIDTDFHFKVKRNGCWMEKRGSTEVRFCELEEDDIWISSTAQYNGPLVFLAKTI